MLFELGIIPLRCDKHMSVELSEIMKIIDASGLPYQLTPSSTCIEGDWDEVMALIKTCHNSMREQSSRVITTIKIDDEEEGRNKLITSVQSVEERLGKKLSRLAP